MEKEANVVEENPQVTATPQYDPEKKYEWKQNDTFVFTGGEFGVLLNALRAILGTAEAQRILLAERASGVVENALARAVMEGRVKAKED